MSKWKSIEFETICAYQALLSTTLNHTQRILSDGNNIESRLAELVAVTEDAASKIRHTERLSSDFSRVLDQYYFPVMDLI